MRIAFLGRLLLAGYLLAICGQLEAKASVGSTEAAMIDLQPNGKFKLNGQLLVIDGLKQKLLQIATIDSGQQVILRGAETVPYSFVAEVLDACRAAKLTNISFSVNPEKGDRG